MFRKPHIFAIAILLTGSLLRAADSNPAEAKLRESLRATMLQLRAAETERANLQAAQIELEQKNKTLTAQLESLTKQAAAERKESDRAIAEFKLKTDERELELAGLRDNLEKWKAAYKQAADLARKTDGERAKATEKAVLLERRVADQQRRNAEMFKLSTEILARYEKFGLGEALTAREPFVGITRVKFENLIQDYSDKIADQKIKP
jgi:hypothetical protein